MNNFENKIKNILKKEIEHPLSYEYAIKNSFYSKKEKKKNNYFLKLITSTVCIATICTTVMATTYTIYKNVWQEPHSSNIEQELSNVKKEISEEEKINFITEETAIEKSKNILNKLGYENTQINNIELIRGYDNNYSCHYNLYSNDIFISLNPLNGNLEYFGDNSINNKIIKNDNISKEEIEEIATGIYNNLEIFKEDENYEIVNTQKSKMVSGKIINDFWQVSFGKIFNGNYDKNSVSTICFTISNNKIMISSITGLRKSDFENNPIIISKNDAIKIATNKEKEFSNLKISNINAKLSIEKMNIFIYCLENNLTNENGDIKIIDKSRNVWVVNIEHEKNKIPKDTKIEEVKKLYNKKYFIDATTGEIIGGEQSEFFND